MSEMRRLVGAQGIQDRRPIGYEDRRGAARRIHRRWKASSRPGGDPNERSGVGRKVYRYFVVESKARSSDHWVTGMEFWPAPCSVMKPDGDVGPFADCDKNRGTASAATFEPRRHNLVRPTSSQ
jgi:hypothetical protein